MGKKLKILGIVSGIMLVVFAGAVLTLMIMFPPEKIKSLIIPQVEKALNRKVTLEKASLSFFPVFGINLSGAQISNTSRQGFSSGPFVKVDNLLIRVPVFSFLKKQPEIARIIIKKPEVLLEIDSTGSFNFDDLAGMDKKEKPSHGEPSSGESSDTLNKKSGGGLVLPVPITLKELTIQDGVFTYSDKRSGQQFIIGDIDETIRFAIDKELKDVKTSGDLVLDNVSVKTKEISKPLNNLKITLSHDVQADLVSGKAEVKKLRLSFQKVFLNLAGTVDNFNAVPKMDLKIDSDPIEIKDILAEIPVELSPELAKLSASGTLELDLAINGSFEQDKKLPIQGSLSINNGMVKYKDLPKSINNINTSLNFTDNSIDIKNLKLLFGSNPVSLKGTVNNFAKPVVDLLINADLNLKDVEQMITLPKGASVDGAVKADITAKGEVDPSDPSKLDVKGKADLKNVAVLWPPLAKAAVINGLFTLSSKAIGEELSVKIGHSSLKMDAAVSNYLSLVFADSTKKLPRPTADFKLTSPLLNFDEFLPVKENSSAQASANVENTKDNASEKSGSKSSVPLIAPLPGVDMKGTVTASKIIYQAVEMKNMKMNVSVVNDVANVDINTGFASGVINEKIYADIRNTRSVTIKNNLNLSDIEVNELLLKFGNFLQPTTALNRELRNVQKNLYGKINLTSDLTMNGGTSEELSKSLKGVINANITNGKISNSLILSRISGMLEKFIKVNDISFRKLKTTLLIEDETVYFDDFNLQSDDAGDWEVKGNVGFDAKLDMNINNRMTKSASEKVLSVQNTGKSKLQGLLQGTKLGGAASGLLDNVGIPSDADGRITLKIALNGTASDPKPSFAGFGEGSKEKSGQPQNDAKASAAKQAKDVVEKNKAVVEKKMAEEGQKLKEEVKQKMPEIKKHEKEIKDKAVQKLKKLF